MDPDRQAALAETDRSRAVTCLLAADLVTSITQPRRSQESDESIRMFRKVKDWSICRDPGVLSIQPNHADATFCLHGRLTQAGTLVIRPDSNPMRCLSLWDVIAAEERAAAAAAAADAASAAAAAAAREARLRPRGGAARRESKKERKTKERGSDASSGSDSSSEDEVI